MPLPEKNNYGPRIIISIILIAISCVLYYLINNFLAKDAFQKGMYDYRRGLTAMAEYFGNSRREVDTAKDCFADSIKRFERYLKTYKNDPKAYFMLGNSYYNLYDIDIKRTIRASGPGNEDKVPLDNYNKAVDAFNKAISYSPTYPDAHYYLARCYMNKDFVKAYEELNMAKKYLPEFYSSDITRKALWENNINKTLEGFPGIEISEDVMLSGGRVKFINVSDSPAAVAICPSGSKIPEDSEMSLIPTERDNILIKDIAPDKSYNTFIIIGSYIISGTINPKVRTVYTIHVRPLVDNFILYDPKIMEGSKK